MSVKKCRDRVLTAQSKHGWTHPKVEAWHPPPGIQDLTPILKLPMYVDRDTKVPTPSLPARTRRRNRFQPPMFSEARGNRNASNTSGRATSVLNASSLRFGCITASLCLHQGRHQMTEMACDVERRRCHYDLYDRTTLPSCTRDQPPTIDLSSDWLRLHA
ncbi:hypothetical protein K458DRAFT_436510 [Lentithecium fluviatile CBS 122367]|uniref:Uncharacterized protein n=1 Tax=Lentithecium fluviatile CBS 122367 TaxID=1168545 RepID=A0A6G1IH78_9PLEO|nr:hypothetical protein K458DRAFT_436510 [Lentithecium fluviatile CBS 122367]